MRKAGDALGDFINALGVRNEGNALGLFASWKKLAGEQLAMVAKPRDLKGSVLLLEVAHPGWITRVQFSEKEILQKIQREYPQLGIKSIAYRINENTAGLADSQEIMPSEKSTDASSDLLADVSTETKQKADESVSNAEPQTPVDLASVLERLKKTL